ncbi:GNAT family N-acetyltransferase [Paenibacillus sp. MWE-103]|uniref:GNAT family N-acetyltransferase n=1 Tax=Paenibacillus artemisiicola TaxID=1172618 RepID=A0ABS3WB79_9BACL|nr:GNAT family N-acetyltransferase [Paenibacillus artemisiicola]MBO7745567.1 GNAT family N-acetyltransferase [Paenibacillus artemisiicola]
MELSFRRASRGLIAAELAILNANPYFNRLSKDKERLTAADVEAEHRDAEAAGAERYVLFADGEPVGVLEFLMINPNDACAWIGLLVIRSQSHGRGYGKRALAWFDALMRDRGVTVHRLGVLAGNAPAHAFWRSQGAAEVKPAVLPDGKPIVIYERFVRGGDGCIS